MFRICERLLEVGTIEFYLGLSKSFDSRLLGVTIPDAGRAVIAPEMLALYVHSCFGNLRFYFTQPITNSKLLREAQVYSISANHGIYGETS